MRSQDRELLVRRARGGDLSAFDALLSEVRSRARNVAARLVGSDRCEDVLQDASLRALRSLDQLSSGGAFPGWFIRIVVRVSYDTLRRDRFTSPEESLVTALDRHAPNEGTLVDRHLIHRTLEQMYPQELRVVLTLRELEGLSYDEIADQLEIPVGTVRSRLHTARRRFRDIYQGEK